jgi:hypothetical protein
MTHHKIVHYLWVIKFLLIFFAQNAFYIFINFVKKGENMTNIITLPNKSLRESIVNKKMELFEVKQMAEMEKNYKTQCQVALKDYKAWHRHYQDETDALELFYGQLHGTLLKRRAQDAVQAYWIIRQDFRVVFDRYLAMHQSYYSPQFKHKSA